ncbi:efflux RND transporter permease subunit [Lentisphaera marina]|nr:efflux RND transporter permease subunit [Lentisphaera marina]MDD7984139.1 efflux RND transporter permease subunit [Lentisphaera marina]
MDELKTKKPESHGMMDKIIKFCLLNKLLVFLLVIASLTWGVMVSPFDWEIDALPRDPVPVDAIPDIGENQQIVFTRWPGRSPQDMEDQVTYPLTTALLGVPEVKTIRSFSMFGFSSIYIIFEESAEFYWSRSRVLEKLNALPAGTLPDGVKPMLGPDATALGQVYWYTLEGLAKNGIPTGGWDLHELRSIQDWYVRYGLLGAEGISEVASVGGYVQEYQIDVDPEAMRIKDVTLDQIFMAIKMSNMDVGARTIEINKAEYIIRGLGFIKSLEDIEKTVVKTSDNIPILVKDVANVALGPALRRGILDKQGAEAVGGVAVVRYGENPLEAIKSLKGKIKEISPGLPSKVIIDYNQVDIKAVRNFAEENGFEAFTKEAKLNQDEWKSFLSSGQDPPKWLTLSQVKIVPFYDRAGLIKETLGTLETAITQQVLITIIVILVMMMHLRSSGIISITLPFAVILCFIAMKIFGVDANIVALSGIAIAIGTLATPRPICRRI